MDRKIRVGAVSYLNTKPLLYGIENSSIINEISLITEYPAKIADQLLNDEIDIGLVPVAIIPHMRDYHLNTQYCIGCDGPVASVCLFSEVPVHEIKTVLLDYQSRTSVALAKILFEKHWKQKPVFEQSGPDFIKDIRETTAAVVIGDRALHQRSISPYIYDLGEEWKEMTALPFVFAAWVSNKKLDGSWVNRFNEANAFGLQNMEKVIAQFPTAEFDLHEYYTRYLSYDLNDKKREGLTLFIKMLAENS